MFGQAPTKALACLTTQKRFSMAPTSTPPKSVCLAMMAPTNTTTSSTAPMYYPWPPWKAPTKSGSDLSRVYISCRSTASPRKSIISTRQTVLCSTMPSLLWPLTRAVRCFSAPPTASSPIAVNMPPQNSLSVMW